jgi:hypothetical protein
MNFIFDSVATLSNGWAAKIVTVTPDMARKMLEHNDGNRPKKKSVVARYAAVMLAGNWSLSPDGLIFGRDGRLLQGQHRLSAVIVADVPIDFVVWTNVDDNVFRVLDRGAIRTASDALGIDRKLSEVGGLIARLVSGSNARPLDEDIMVIAEALRDYHDYLIDGSTSSTPIVSAAPFRAAACARMMSGYDKQYIKSVFDGLVHGDVASLPRIAQSVVAAIAARKFMSTGGGTKQTEYFVRAWDVFDPTKRDNERIIIRDSSRAIKDLRKVFNGVLDDN